MTQAAVNTRPGTSDTAVELARVVGMLDTLAAGDVALTISGLEELLARLRQAEAARELLVDVDRDTLKKALILRRQREVVESQR